MKSVRENALYIEEINYILSDKRNFSRMAGKTVMLTGATGMLGTFLVDVLMAYNNVAEEPIKIIATSRNRSKLEERFCFYLGDRNFKIYEVDVTKKIDIQEHVDFIIHAASNTHPREYSTDPVGTITTNMLGSFNLLEFARTKQIDGIVPNVILISSVEIYGENTTGGNAWKEGDCGYIDCNTARAGYPESKRVSEALLQSYISQYGMQGMIIRLCRSYGPTLEKDDSKALSQFIKKAVSGENIILKSQGTQFFSYIYSADAIEAILRIINCGENGEAYNVADPKSDIRLRDLAEIIAESVGKNVVFDIPDSTESKGYSKATVAILDASKLNALGWKARFDIKSGLKRTIDMLTDENQ